MAQRYLYAYKVNPSHQMSRASGRSRIQISDRRRATSVSLMLSLVRLHNWTLPMPIYLSPNIFVSNINQP